MYDGSRLVILFFIVKFFLKRCNLHRARYTVMIIMSWSPFLGEVLGYTEYLVLLN